MTCPDHPNGSASCALCFSRTLPEFFAHCWPTWPCECGPGWFAIIRRLAAIKPEGVRVAQVKEKFGYLNVYHDGHDDAEWVRAVHEAAQESARTCEQCGEPGTIGGDGWITTACEAHR